MSLNRLPTEILTEIFQDVALLDDGCADGQNRGLVNLSLCSQWMHQLVEPILYSSYRESTRLALLKFLRTIINYPHLADRVRQFKGQDRVARFIDDPESPSPIAYDNWDMKSTIRPSLLRVESDESLVDAWSRTIYAEDWDATTALTLLCLPQLRHLHLDLAGLQERVVLEGGGMFQDIVEFQPTYYGWIQYVLKWAAQLQQQPGAAPRALENLTSVTIRTFDQDGRGLAFNDLVPFLKLKSVRTLRLEDCHLKQCSLREPLALSTTDISLWNCSIEPSQLEQFISYFPFLHRLHYQHFNINKVFEPNSVVRALTQKAAFSPLKELYLLDPSECSSNKLDGWPMASLAPLRHLEILDTVAFDQWVEKAWDSEMGDFHTDLRPMYDLVPRSLRHLTLRQATRETILQVIGLLEYKALRPPRLRTVRLVFTEDFAVDGVRREGESLTEMAQRCGVEVLMRQGGERVDFDEDDDDSEFW